MLRGIALAVVGLVACSSPASIDVREEQQLSTLSKPVYSATMTCAQMTDVCTPPGYRFVQCKTTGMKVNANVVPCVRAVCPAVYTFADRPSGETESCDRVRRTTHDGEAHSSFAVLPDAAYDFVTYAVNNQGEVGAALATASLAVTSSIGDEQPCTAWPELVCQ